MEQALKDKISLAVPSLEAAAVGKLVADLLQDGLTSVDELKKLDANTLATRYSVPYFKALELAEKFQSTGNHDSRAKDNIMSVSAQLTSANKKFAINWNKFPPTLLKDISAGKIPTESDRREMVKRLVEDVRHQIPSADRSFFVPISRKINTQFPDCFGDIIIRSKLEIAMSLCTQLKNCYDNARRTEKTELEQEAPGARNPRAYGCRRWQLVNLPENETEVSQEEKREQLIQIIETVARRDWDWDLILLLMEATYGTLRKEINVMSKVIFELQKAERLNKAPKLPRGVVVEDCVVAKVTERWPFLFIPKANAQHFQKLTDVDLKESIEKFLEDFGNDLIKFFTEQRKTKEMAKKLEKLYTKNRNPTNDESLLLMTILLMFSSHFQEDFNIWLGKVDEGTTVGNFSERVETQGLGKHPVVLTVGAPYTAKKFYVTVDQEIETATRTFLEAFSISFGFYYIFGLNYPCGCSQTMDFVQRGIMGINPRTGSKTTAKKGTRASTTISPKLLRFFRTFNISIQQDGEDIDLNMNEYNNLMAEQMEDDFES